MPYLFIIISQNRIYVYERDEQYTLKQLYLKGELVYKVKQEDFKKAGEVIYEELIDIKNLSSLESYHVFILHDRLESHQVHKFIGSFITCFSYQILLIKNLLASYTAYKRCITKDKPSYTVAFDYIQYKVKANQHRFIEVSETKGRSDEVITVENLINYAASLAVD